ncbi:MAG TPA: MerR family transcriptional regulator [Nitrospirota bacterium]|nr:MerR family transcriptional regulator [Nitrospirota bacterium]
MISDDYAITELMEKLRERGFADVTRRKIRFFVETGLIPGPSGKGGGARYGEDHLLRILAINKLRKTFWKIADIKSHLKNMSPEDIRQFTLTPEPVIPAPNAEGTDGKLRRGLLVRSSTFESFTRKDASTTSGSHPSGLMSADTWHRLNVMEGMELNMRSDALRRLMKEPPDGKREILASLEMITLGRTSRAVSSRESGIPSSLSERFECDLINGRLLAVIGGQRALLDTGFPFSFGQCGSITLCGREFAISKGAYPTTEELSKLIETEFSLVLGADVLSRLDFRIDLPELEITFSENFGAIRGSAVPLRIISGLPVLTARLPNGEFPFLISTGMKLSFLDSNIASTFPVVGKGSDAIPRIGKFEGTKFETDLRRIKVRLEEKNLKLSFGVLPDVIEDSTLKGFGVMGIVMGILGAELFANNPACVSYRRQRLTFL